MENRNSVIDMARGTAMILVLIGHALEIGFNPMFRADGVFSLQAFEIWRLIYSFHVPIFFFISGVVSTNFKDKGATKVVSSALSLIIIACLFDIISSPIARYNEFGPDLLLVIMKLLKPLLLGHHFYLVVTWFLVSYAFVQVLAYFFCMLDSYRKALFICGMFALYVYVHKNGIQFMQLHTWSIGFIFFISGSALSGAVKNFPENNTSYISTIFCGSLGLFLYKYNNGCLYDPFHDCKLYGFPEFSVMIILGSVGFIPLFLLTAFSGIALTLGICTLIQGSLFERFLVYVGKNTLVTLIMNGMFFRFIQPIIGEKISAEYWVVSVILSVILQVFILPLSIVLTEPLIKLSQRLAAFIVNSIKRPAVSSSS